MGELVDSVHANALLRARALLSTGDNNSTGVEAKGLDGVQIPHSRTSFFVVLTPHAGEALGLS